MQLVFFSTLQDSNVSHRICRIFVSNERLVTGSQLCVTFYMLAFAMIISFVYYVESYYYCRTT